jgi:pimeloyl-ACP methyl ester carboxylesterase
MPTIETSHGAIYYADQRRDDAQHPPLLLIHGAGGSRLDWPRELRRLNALVIDLPGHGKSGGTGSDTIEAYTQTISAFLQALDVPRAVLGGHSMGGAISMTLALEQPQQVAGLLLVGTGAKLKVHAKILDNIQKEQDKVGSLLKTWMWGVHTLEDTRQRGYEMFMQIDPHVVYRDYLACNRFDIRDRLHEITAPTLVIGGSNDRMTPLHYSEYLRDHIPGAELVVIEGGGHLMALEDPEQVSTAVERWLNTL